MNKRIQILSFLWALGIVLFHAGSGGCSILYNELIADFRVGGVSFFYVVSGYFLMKHFNGQVFLWWKTEMLKRLKTLLIPYFIWCTLGIQGLDVLRQYGLLSLAPSANPPLWYVKFLFLFCLISPLIVLLVVKIRKKSEIFVWVLLVLIVVLPYASLPMKFSFFHSFLMFSLGIGLSFVDKDLKRRLESFKIVPIGLSFWVICLMVRVLFLDLPLQFKWALNVYSALSLMISLWIIFKVTTNWQVYSWLKVTFFVYCMHGIMLRYFRLTGFPPIDGVIVFVLCVMIGYGMSRILPLVYRILTANR